MTLEIIDVTLKIMKQITFLLLLLLVASFPTFGQIQEKPNFVGDWYMAQAESQSTSAPLTTAFFELVQSNFSRYRYYKLKANVDQLNSLMNRKPEIVSIAVPYGDRVFILDLARIEITDSAFQVNSKDANTGVQYRGIVNGNLAHIASVSFTETDKSIYFSTDAGNFVVTQKGKDFIVYNDQVIKAPITLQCETLDEGAIEPFEALATGELINKVVKVYFECDYALYQSKGSIANVTNYVIGFFSQVATLYANENINLQIGDMYIWTSPDPYAGYNSPSAILTPFRTTRGTNFNGNIAHFLTTRNIGGGVAYVNTMCNKAYAYGVSRIYSTYSTFPAYSWTINVVAHELGHTIGSPHTQSCSWGSAALDNCYPAEGNCSPGPAPINGGTIMSYCHLTNYGINFNQGFGLQPGNLLRSRVTSATCLATDGGGTGTCQPPNSLITTNITSHSANLNWNAVSGATSYTIQYKLSTATTWILAGATSGTGFAIINLSPISSYLWTVKADCSPFAPNASFITTGQAGGCTSPSGLATTSITQASARLNWMPVSGATNYIVQYKACDSGAWITLPTTTSTNRSISGLNVNTSYTWQVKTNCSTYSAVRNFTTL